MNHVHLISAGFSPFFYEPHTNNPADIDVIAAEILSGQSEVCAAGKIPTVDSRDIVNKFINHSPKKNTPNE